jgi:hypothetical protein
MRTFIRIVRQGGLALLMTFACVAAGVAPVAARAAVPLYEVAVPLKGATPEDRAAGMADALRTVAVKASGRREAAGSPVVSGANPAKYVQRYSTTADKMLKVGFDGRAIEQLLQQAGLPLWPAERPLVVIEAPVPDRAAVERAAQWRGVPVEWGAGAGAPAAAGRAVLTGVASGGEFAWTFTHDGRSSQMRGSAEDGIHLAADALAARYAPASTRSSSTLALRVDGMEDLADYSGLLAYLRGLSLVRGVDVESLDGTVITLRVVVRGDRELLGRIVALGGRLQPGGQSEADAAAAADFVYQP